MGSIRTSTGPGRQAMQPGDGVDISAARARGAYKGRRVLWMLLVSLALVVAAFVIAFATNPTAPAADRRGGAQVKEPAVVQSFQAPEPAPKVPG